MLDFAIFAITFVLLLVGAVLYLYPASRQALDIPGMAPTDEKDGNLPDIITSGSLHEFLVILHEKYGPIVSFWFGRRLVVSLGSADLLKQHINPNRISDPFEMILKSLLRYQSGLSGDAGESHLRKKLYENGVTKSLQSNFAVIQKLSEELLAKWLSFPESQHVPLCQHMLGFAMKSVTQTAMGSYFEDDQEVIQFRRNHDAIWAEIGKGFLDGSLDKSATRKKQYENALMEMELVLKKVIKERRDRSFHRHIFIDSLLQGNLSDKQILEDTMIFSLAGCVITANLCTWAVYFLTTSEEIQKNLYKEIDQVLGKGPVTLEKIEQLRYCRQVLCETVRTAKLTPVAARLQELEGRVDQHVIPKETLVLYALGVVLQDSSAWPSPYKFDPDRFHDESAMKNLSLLGFSGSQECPELRFAYMVATVLLSVLVRKLYLHPVKEQVTESKYELVTSPKEEAWIIVSKRKQGKE
ncbi:PREDICTED: cytochrome P450 20A1 [Crocodylus porosus]|uniref:Cytochrome P450 family 20 subfamily A member 1 n=1 Tax=Crocodylus porosus TaxID=8502 RepID=A0A7M4DZB0_CROPO|nr:PREDICTED: cytochrome P450 20A1 [Crocodylus porosus]